MFYINTKGHRKIKIEEEINWYILKQALYY